MKKVIASVLLVDAMVTTLATAVSAYSIERNDLGYDHWARPTDSSPTNTIKNNPEMGGK